MRLQLRGRNFIKRDSNKEVCSLLKATPTQVFSCENGEFSKNNYIEENQQSAASVH